MSKLCEEWRIRECKNFKEFCGFFDIKIGESVANLKSLCLEKIREYCVKGKIFYTNYALTENDLFSKIFFQIIDSIKDGEVILSNIIEAFIDWCTKNKVAYESTKRPDKKINEAKKEYFKEFQKKFPHIPLLKTTTDYYSE